MLSFLSHVYGAVTSLRNYLYDKGIFQVHSLGARTISVGNITAGGTGKTPLVAHIASVLARRGEKVCILTRGYGRKDERRRVLVSDGIKVLADAATGGDEPVELAQKLLGQAIVIAGADRVSSAEWARRKFDVTVFLLDDGLQHRAVKRDVDIVCVDATEPFGGDKLLPAGRLRESPRALSRSDAIVLTRVEQAGDLSGLRSQIVSGIAPGTPIFESRTILEHVSNATRDLLDKNKSVLAFCGLGHPENFYSLLRCSGYAIAGSRSYPDHHIYTQEDIVRLEADAALHGANALVTTSKDEVKLADLAFRLPRYVAEIKIELDRENDFDGLLG